MPQSYKSSHLAGLPSSVGANRWFAGLSASHQQSLLSHTTVLSLGDNQLASAQHQPARGPRDGFALLLSGSLKVSSHNASGKEAVLTHIYPGQWFGELALLDGRFRERDVRSIGQSKLLVVEPAQFAMLMADPSFANAVIRLLSTRTRMLLDLVEDFSLHSVRARAARRLVMLARDDDPAAAPARTELSVSHDALASMIGMTRQSLSLQLKALTDIGAIAQGYGRISIQSIVLLMAEAAAS